MVVEVVGAIGGTLTGIKILYDYYQCYKGNQQVLDILTGFSQNLEASLERLQARETLLTGSSSPALESIARDFENASLWLQENDKNLKSKWTALQAAEKLRELDNRLTKSFTSKISLGVFSALQDSRAQTAALSSSLDHLHSSLENIVERASSQSLQKAIALLQEDADMARGRDGHKGFANGEPEKLISALVDKLSAQADLLAEAGEPPRGTNHFWSDSELVRSPHAASTRYASTDASSLLSRRPAQRHTSTTTVRTNGSSRNSDLISFAIRDPLTQQILVDPVLGSDGVIHDRWTLVHEAHPNPHCPTDPVVILGEVVQLQEAISSLAPSTRLHDLRQAYADDTTEMLASGGYPALVDLLERISHILLWDSRSVPWLVRRGLVKFRLRALASAAEDLSKAVEYSSCDEDQVAGKVPPHLDALRYRAIVYDEMHESEKSRQDIDAVLARSPHDVLILSARAFHSASQGDLKEAQRHLTAINDAIEGGTCYLSELAPDDADLDYTARGWAYASIGDYASAATDFKYAMSLRAAKEPYLLACCGHALVKQGVYADGLRDLDEALALCKTVAARSIAPRSSLTSSGATLPQLDKGYPPDAFTVVFLRGMSYFEMGKNNEALADFALALCLRPPCIKDSADLRCAFGMIKEKVSDTDGALREYDRAIALASDPETRSYFLRLRQVLEQGSRADAP